MTFGDAVRESGLRQVWLAEQLGVKAHHVQAVCLGRQRIPAAWVQRVAKLLRLSVADIVQMQTAWELEREAKRGQKAKERRRNCRRGRKRAA